MGSAIDMAGRKYGLLTAIERSPQLRTHWLFSCECGSKKWINAYHVRVGRIRSCGCYWTTERAAQHARLVLVPHSGSNRKHSRSRQRVYAVWKTMRQRCTNPKSRDWRWYGGRGIKVCARWDEFENFIADMGERPDGLTLERRDVNGHYGPENCYWATWTEQRRNKRGKNG
jgi:hypothetical protein